MGRGNNKHRKKSVGVLEKGVHTFWDSLPYGLGHCKTFLSAKSSIPQNTLFPDYFICIRLAEFSNKPLVSSQPDSIS